MGWVSDLEVSDASDDELSDLFRGMQCTSSTSPCETVFGRSALWYQTDPEDDAYQTGDDGSAVSFDTDLYERYMGANKRWQCQRPWCRAVIDGGDACRQCIVSDGKASKLPLPAGHHGIVMAASEKTTHAGYSTNMALYTGSETRKGHAGCTVDIHPSSSTIVIHGSEYPGETYLVKSSAKIFADFP